MHRRDDVHGIRPDRLPSALAPSPRIRADSSGFPDISSRNPISCELCAERDLPSPLAEVAVGGLEQPPGLVELAPHHQDRRRSNSLTASSAAGMPSDARARSSRVRRASGHGVGPQTCVEASQPRYSATIRPKPAASKRSIASPPQRLGLRGPTAAPREVPDDAPREGRAQRRRRSARTAGCSSRAKRSEASSSFLGGCPQNPRPGADTSALARPAPRPHWLSCDLRRPVRSRPRPSSKAPASVRAMLRSSNTGTTARSSDAIRDAARVRRLTVAGMSPRSNDERPAVAQVGCRSFGELLGVSVRIPEFHDGSDAPARGGSPRARPAPCRAPPTRRRIARARCARAAFARPS